MYSAPKGSGFTRSNNTVITPTSSQQYPIPSSISRTTSSRQEKAQYYRKNAGNPLIQPQTFYCETCRVSCVGKQSYTSHIEGQQHIKKQKALQALQSHSESGAPAKKAENFCELCNVSCSNGDAYQAHLRGQKHQKSLKLHARLGKPIPEPVKPPVVKVMPKTHFQSGGSLNTLTGEITPTSQSLAAAAAVAHSTNVSSNPPTTPSVAPKAIGMEFIVEERNAEDKIINYHCKICKCDMNNSFMRDDHLKGKKHLTEYKLKVNSNLKIDNNPKIAAQFRQVERIRRMAEREEMRQRDMRENAMRERIRNLERSLINKFPTHSPWNSFQSPDDQLILRKNTDIQPSSEELECLETAVITIEKTLKLVADALLAKDETKELKGVMRIGPFARGTLLKNEHAVELTLLTENKPGASLAQKVFKEFTVKAVDSDPAIEISLELSEAMILANVKTTVPVTVKIHITSPQIREDLSTETDPIDILDKKLCFTALAEMRRAKWFEARSSRFPSMLIVVRVLRDLCRRIPTWNHFPYYLLELIIDKALRTVAHEMTVGEIIRRFFEVISSGVLLTGDVGIYDPCEKELVNAAEPLTAQNCQDVTTSSQHALRLLALGRIDKILGIAHTPPNEKRPSSAQPKSEEPAEKKSKYEKC